MLPPRASARAKEATLRFRIIDLSLSSGCIGTLGAERFHPSAEGVSQRGLAANLPPCDNGVTTALRILQIRKLPVSRGKKGLSQACHIAVAGPHGALPMLTATRSRAREKTLAEIHI